MESHESVPFSLPDQSSKITCKHSLNPTKDNNHTLQSAPNPNSDRNVSNAVEILDMLLSDQYPVDHFDYLLSKFDSEAQNIANSPTCKKENLSDDLNDNISEFDLDLSYLAKSEKSSAPIQTEEEKAAIRLRNAETAKLWRQKKRQDIANNEDMVGKLQFENKRMELVLSELDRAVNACKELLVNHISRNKSSDQT